MKNLERKQVRGMSVEIRRLVVGVAKNTLGYEEFVAVGLPFIILTDEGSERTCKRDLVAYSRSWLWATSRVLRGSYWRSESGNCRAAERFSENPDDRCFGFRAVRALGKTATGGDYAI